MLFQSFWLIISLSENPLTHCVPEGWRHQPVSSLAVRAYFHLQMTSFYFPILLLPNEKFETNFTHPCAFDCLKLVFLRRRQKVVFYVTGPHNFQSTNRLMTREFNPSTGISSLAIKKANQNTPVSVLKIQHRTTNASTVTLSLVLIDHMDKTFASDWIPGESKSQGQLPVSIRKQYKNYEKTYAWFN